MAPVCLPNVFLQPFLLIMNVNVLNYPGNFFAILNQKRGNSMLFDGKHKKFDNSAALFFQNDPQRFAIFLTEKPCKTVRFAPVSELKLAEARNILTTAYRICQKEVYEGDASVSSGWLLDNFYLLEGTIDRLMINLNKRHFCKVTLIEGVIRSYYIAQALVEFTQGRLDEGVIENFIGAYCVNRPLKMQEIWVMPQMLETALIHFGSSVAADMISQYRQRNEAEKLIRLIRNEPKRRKETIAQAANHNLLGEPSYLEKLIAKAGKRRGKKNWL